jgi:hypothetical protein
METEDAEIAPRPSLGSESASSDQVDQQFEDFVEDPGRALSAGPMHPDC